MTFSQRVFNFGLILAVVLGANLFAQAQTSAVRPRIAKGNSAQTKPTVEVPKVEIVSENDSSKNSSSQIGTPSIISKDGIISIDAETSGVRSRKDGKPKPNAQNPKKEQAVLSSVIVNDERQNNETSPKYIESSSGIITIELNRSAIRPRRIGKIQSTKNTASNDVRRVSPSVNATKQTDSQSGVSSSIITAPIPKPETVQAQPKRSRAKSPTRETSKTAAVTLGQASDLLKDEKFEESARLSETVVEREPNNAEAWKLLGLATYKMQQYEASANILKNAYDLKKLTGETDIEVLKTYAQAFSQTDKSGDALPLLSNETETNEQVKGNADLWSLRGEIEYKTNKVDSAEKSFKQAGELNPSDAKTHYFLGQIGYEKGDYDSAVNSLNRAYTLDTTNEMALRLLTTSYLSRATNRPDSGAKTDNQAAVNFGEKLVKMKPSSENVALYAQTLFNTQQYPQAAQELEKIVDLPDVKSISLYQLGVSYSRSKNYPKAISPLERAAQMSPNNVNIFRELGFAYESTKQKSQALAAYRKVLELAPNDEPLKKKVEKLARETAKNDKQSRAK